MGVAATEPLVIEAINFEDFFCSRFHVVHGDDGMSWMEFIDERPDGPVKVKRCRLPNAGYVRSAMEAAFACLRCTNRRVATVN